LDIGESLVGSYFKYVLGYRMVVYNCPLQGGGELDVVALNPEQGRICLCEVATHLRGLLYGRNYSTTCERLGQKIIRASDFAFKYFPSHQASFMLWSPVVFPGLIPLLQDLQDRFKDRIAVELIINGEYRRRIEKLREMARRDLKSTQEPAYRLLQILEHLREK